jgi:hypothetical protein
VRALLAAVIAVALPVPGRADLARPDPPVPGGADPARPDPDPCAPGRAHRGAPLDLDVKNVELHELFRLLGDVGRVDIVIEDGVSGRTTLRLRRVPWDQVLCSVAAAHHLEVTRTGDVVLVRRAGGRARAASPPSLSPDREQARVDRLVGAGACCASADRRDRTSARARHPLR